MNIHTLLNLLVQCLSGRCFENLEDLVLPTFKCTCKML
ncbi:hypothetical protein V6Z11_A07G139100 [Gossypium hirsutum]